MSPHGEGILFSDIYPGSVSDSKLNEEFHAVYFVESEHKVMSDRGFSIQELCVVRGITSHNRPKEKGNDEFAERDAATNFDIAASRIRVERFTGRFIIGEC